MQLLHILSLLIVGLWSLHSALVCAQYIQCRVNSTAQIAYIHTKETFTL